MVATEVRAPADPAMRHIARLFDAEAMTKVLQRALGTSPRVAGTRGCYLRYKPGTNLVVHYDVQVNGKTCSATAMVAASADLLRRAGKPENVGLARLAADRSIASMPLFYDRPARALIQFWPLELKLPALAEPPARLVAALVAAGMPPVGEPDSEPQRLAYKPRRRAVLRLGEHVVKVYARDDQFTAAWDRLQKVSSMPGVRTARAVAAQPRRRVTVQRFLPGSDLGRPSRMAPLAGEVLRLLHRCPTEGLPQFPPKHQLDIAAASGRLVTAIAPELGERVASLVRGLREQLPQTWSPVASHGDYHARQLLGLPGGIGVIDFDGMRAADAALDPATFAAHMVRGRPGDVETAAAALDAMIQGYGPRPAHLSWYWATSILRRAPFPFRDLDGDWPQMVGEMIRSADRALAW